MKITFSQLRSLVVVAESGSVGAAANKLNMTQSAISQSIITLEKQLSTTLLTRTRNGMVPTAIAQEVIRDADIAVAAVERIETFASTHAFRNGSWLRIASVPSIAAGPLAKWSRRFHSLYPDVKISVFEGSHLEVCDWVIGGVADVGLTSIVPPELDAEDIRRDELVVVARFGSHILRNGAITVEDLRNEVLITSNQGCDMIVGKLLSPSEGVIRRSICANDIRTTLEMVRQGLGVTILPKIAMIAANMIDLRMANFVPRAYRPLYCVNVSGRASNIIKAFIDAARMDADVPLERVRRFPIRQADSRIG